MYIGQTQDILKRWREHNSGIGSEHTQRHKPLHIIHYEEFLTREEAVKRESDLKTGFGRKWLKREWKAGHLPVHGLTQTGARQAGQCGWLKDKYGLSWQIVPVALGEMMRNKDAEKSKRVTQAMLQMKKIDIEGLKKAYEQG